MWISAIILQALALVASALKAPDVTSCGSYATYALDTPIDHLQTDQRFEPHTNATFPLRYVVVDDYYRPGGPVILHVRGESDVCNIGVTGKTCILDQMAEATGGMIVMLEHRYYGESLPFQDLSSVESLRFLALEQVAWDVLYFAGRFEHNGRRLGPIETPWILYGSSYAGAVVSLIPSFFPDIFHGFIVSSAPTRPVVDFWEFSEAARLHAPQDCVTTHQKLTHVVDNIALGENNTEATARLLNLFNMGCLSLPEVGMRLHVGMASWLHRTWQTGDDLPYCRVITSEYAGPVSQAVRDRQGTIREMLELGGYGDEVEQLTTPFSRFVDYLRMEPECLGVFSGDDPHFDHTVRMWTYQQCSQWGLFSTGAGAAPADQLPLISRLVDVHYYASVCKSLFNISELPYEAVATINVDEEGIFDQRAVFVDGEYDPYRWAGVNSPNAAPEREEDTTITSIVIPGAGHHWEYSAGPPQVVEAQNQIVEAVKGWLQ